LPVAGSQFPESIALELKDKVTQVVTSYQLPVSRKCLGSTSALFLSVGTLYSIPLLQPQRSERKLVWQPILL